ncbi:MAG: bifunctional isocitrate dehydrogenase kinase/phosphatase [Pseudomonadota bacterium]|nr:bifunctional isocitrate dehydrogenase kinase/phosphatase [Pseudomonadota bacterium]
MPDNSRFPASAAATVTANASAADHVAPKAVDLQRHQRRELAHAAATLLLEGFNKHYRLFRAASQDARRMWVEGDWLRLTQATTERIAFYDRRVLEAVDAFEHRFGSGRLDDETWQFIKLEYICLLVDHKQPELAESFFNSVCCKILHRTYFSNDFIFVRPGVSTEHIPSHPPAYRCYYPLKSGLRAALHAIIDDLWLERPFTDLRRDLQRVVRRWREFLPAPLVLEANHQIQVLSSLFFRNTSAYLVGKVINGSQQYPFVVAILHDSVGGLYIDTVLLEAEHLAVMLNSSRAYFMVDMEVPSAYVTFLRTLLPNKPKAELYSILGLQKQGKTLFYRDFLHHLAHSSDDFVIAPGIRGLVMLVFTLPSYPYVFKVIKDVIAPPKQVNREQVKDKYQLVKQVDRVGRMADTLEYSDVAFPKARFDQELLRELRALAPSLLEEDERTVVIRHLYIERRMVPLNIYLDRANPAQREHALKEYGNAVKELAKSNIFAGDLLFKNFGVTRYNRVIFYDYDEIDYVTRCNFRRIPAPRNEEDELAAEPWYSINPNDIFPEEWATFLLTDPRTREVFMACHADLFDAQSWQAVQARLKSGDVPEVIPYPGELRFRNVYGEGAAHRPPRRPAAPRLQPMSDLPEGYEDAAARRAPYGRFSIESD